MAEVSPAHTKSDREHLLRVLSATTFVVLFQAC